MWTKRNSKRGIERALQLQNRGEARKDGLQLVSTSTRLDITWTARDVHPWDRHGSQEQTGAQFVRQALNDAEDAITRLFDNLPDIDEIGVSVLESGSAKIIMAGTVHRSSLAKQTAASAKMRLMNWGIRFSVAGSFFEPVSNR
jgi:hypothetical protein